MPEQEYLPLLIAGALASLAWSLFAIILGYILRELRSLRKELTGLQIQFGAFIRQYEPRRIGDKNELARNR